MGELEVRFKVGKCRQKWEKEGKRHTGAWFEGKSEVRKPRTSMWKEMLGGSLAVGWGMEGRDRSMDKIF